MKRKATAIWQGNGMEGKGSLSSISGVFKSTLYSFVTRFKNEEGIEGTNPEELIAAAHGGCFAMALSFALTNAGCPVSRALSAVPISLAVKLL